MQKILAIGSVLCYTIEDNLDKYVSYQEWRRDRLSETTATCARKVLIPEDEKIMSSGDRRFFCVKKGKENEKSIVYIRIGNRGTSR